MAGDIPRDYVPGHGQIHVEFTGDAAPLHVTLVNTHLVRPPEAFGAMAAYAIEKALRTTRFWPVTSVAAGTRPWAVGTHTTLPAPVPTANPIAWSDAPPSASPRERIREAEETVNKIIEGIEAAPSPDLTEHILYKAIYHRGVRIEGIEARIDRLAREGR